MDDKEFDQFLMNELQPLDRYKNDDAFVMQVMHRATRATQHRTLVRAIVFGLIGLWGFLMLPWRETIEALNQTPISLTFVVTATFITVLIQVWAFTREN